MATKTPQSRQLEQTAKKMRQIVESAQRTLLEFEVMMSKQEIKEGNFESFETVRELRKALD